MHSDEVFAPSVACESILEQNLFGEFFLSEEELTVPLVFRISTADVDEPVFR